MKTEAELRRREIVAATRNTGCRMGELDGANTYVKVRGHHATAGRQRKNIMYHFI